MKPSLFYVPFYKSLTKKKKKKKDYGLPFLETFFLS